MDLICISGWQVIDAETDNKPLLEDEWHLTYVSSQEVLDIERGKQLCSFRKRSQKNDNAKIISLMTITSYAKDKAQKTYTGHIIKLSVKAQNRRKSTTSSQKFLE